MTEKLVLDTGQLDVDFVYATYGLILDDSIQGKLDESALNPQSSFNYANSSLGILNANAQAIREVEATAQTNLGAISSIAQSVVTHFAQGATNLGGLTAEADTTPTILPLFDASLGSINSALTAVVTKLATATATLGQLTGSVQATPEVEITATANLGSLIAIAQTSQPTPPEPQHYGSNGYVPIKKKQKKERPTPVIVVEITDVPELPPLIKSHFASGSTDLFGLSAQAGNRIDFSILADEAEILSLL
jgi:archaellum component FlaF (FlaF/FlaG flagellin family)